MADRPQFPAATGLWFEYLSGIYAPVRVSNKVLPDAKFIRVRRTGGTVRDLVTDNAQMTIECYAPDDKQAEEFAMDVRHTVHNTAGRSLGNGIVCKGITEYSGPYEDPDENHGSSRFSWTFAGALRAATG